MLPRIDKYYKITEEYISSQESLGVENALQKFIEWRLYWEFNVNAPSKKDAIYKLSCLIASQLPENQKDELLQWLNFDIASMSLDSAVDGVVTIHLIESVNINAKILDPRHLIDFSQFDFDPIYISEDCLIDTRFIELEKLKRNDNKIMTPKMFVESINIARAFCAGMNEQKKTMILTFVNHCDDLQVGVNNYTLKSFLEDFEVTQDANWKTQWMVVINCLYQYVMSNFDYHLIEYQSPWRFRGKKND